MTVTISAQSKIYTPGIQAALDGCLGSLDNIFDYEIEQREQGCLLVVEIETENGSDYDEGIAAAVRDWADVTEGIADLEIE